MHPDIYSFWENNGFKIIYQKKDGIWWARKTDYSVKIARKSFLNPSKFDYADWYIWENKEVSEEYMLKLIKMRAFL